MDYVDPLYQALDSTFKKTAFQDITDNYLSIVGKVKKWLCYSDYYLNDDKPNKVISHTLIPHLVDYIELAKEIKRIQKKDIKHTRTINPDFLQFLKNFPILNFSFILEGHDFLMVNNYEELRTILKNTFEQLIQRIKIWRVNNPKRQVLYDTLEMKLKAVLSLIGQGKKIYLIRDMVLVSFLGGYVCRFIVDQTGADKLGWFSDRDAINDIVDNVSVDLFNTYFGSGLNRKCEFLYSRATSSSNEFYEDYTRIPDYITGTLADYNFKQEAVSKDKFSDMLVGFFADNEVNNFIFRLNFNNNGTLECDRITFYKKCHPDL
jgi:hypothetical protein